MPDDASTTVKVKGTAVVLCGSTPSRTNVVPSNPTPTAPPLRLFEGPAKPITKSDVVPCATTRPTSEIK